MTGFYVIMLCVLCGLVSAGIVKNTYQLITAQEIDFNLEYEKGVNFWTRLLVYVFAGPLIIMKNAIELRRSYNAASIWMLLSAFIFLGWSFIIGLTVIGILLATF